jgi:cytochrome c-type biogenesis protein CcmH/NrfG
MARGAASAQRKQRPKPDPKKRSNKAPSWEEQLFFSRLRRHAKVIYVLLALVFVFSFVLLGVGSGSNGISDALQSVFGQNSGTSIGSQIKDKQQAVARQPKDVNLYLDLAGLYQSDNQEAKALATLRQARQVAPKNIDVLTRIASIYGGQAGREGDNYRNVLAVYSQNVTTPPGLDTSSQIGQALTSDPYSQALQTQLNDAYTKVITAYQKVAGVYKQAAQVAKGTSDEPNSLLQWASAAQSANDVGTAVTAYQRFLKVAPDNPNAAAVRQTLAQLQASAAQPQG